MLNERNRTGRTGFTLVELLVVIGIIAVLIAMLMPAIASAKRQAVSVNCKANLRTNYQFMLMYANDNKGWWVPPGKGWTPLVPENERWPVYVFPSRQWNPPTMICPADHEPYGEHSYILNNHVLDKGIRHGKKGKDGLNASDIILMGEKKTTEYDYYMEIQANGDSDFWIKVEAYRHGLTFGSNYLMMDSSVTTQLPQEAALAMDPWDPVVPKPPDVDPVPPQPPVQ